MIPTLLLPAGLAALAALALPLLLHLVRREQQRPVDFAALRWLSARIRPRRRLRVDERLLLALRLLLIALLALLLARPALPLAGNGAAWVVAVPGVGEAALRDAVAGGGSGRDAGAGGNGERRWLAAGFPPLGAAPPAVPAGATISLLRELDMRMPAGTPLVVLVPPVLEGVDAERPRLSRPVDWRVVPAADGAVPGQADDDPAGAGDGGPPPAPRIVIADAGSPPGARYLRAAAAAWRQAAGPEVRAWLAPGLLPADAIAWIEAGGTALLAHDTSFPGSDAVPLAWRDDRGRPLLHATTLGRGRVLQWTRPLDPAAMPALLDADFPHRLRAALQPPAPPSRVLSAEHAPRVGGVGPWPPPMRELSPWLAAAIALLFLLERWLATASRREPAP